MTTQQNFGRENFDEQTIVLLRPDSPDSRSYFGFVQRLLYQYRLNGAYSIQEVMAEAHLRGVKQIENGKQIFNPLSWYKGTSLRIIQEWRRAQNKAEKPVLDPTNEVWQSNIDQLIFNEDLEVIHRAFNTLDEETQQLLSLRIIQGLSWRLIGQTLISETGEEVSANTLRQKGFRAIKRLRKLYTEMRDTTLVDVVVDDTAADKT